MALDVREADQGTNIQKCLKHEEQEMLPWPESKSLVFNWGCGKHGNNHVTNRVSETIDDLQERHASASGLKRGSLTNAVSAFCRFCAMGNYWLRLNLAAEKVIPCMLKTTTDPPSVQLSGSPEHKSESVKVPESAKVPR